MAYTDQQMLADIETAIQAIIAGSVTTYMIEGRTATYLDLQKLYDIRRQLQTAINRASSSLYGVAEIRRAR